MVKFWKGPTGANAGKNVMGSGFLAFGHGTDGIERLSPTLGVFHRTYGPASRPFLGNETTTTMLSWSFSYSTDK